MKLSIIVPVYNVEKYIIKCISSLLCQDYADYEIIIVNDGTEDRSIKLIQQNFDDLRIRIINQENQGLSQARNTGMKEACGEYVWFFDSDDWVSENVLGNIVQSLKDCDILYFTRSYEENSDGITKEKIETMCHSSNGRELPLREYPHCVPFFIYSREFLVRNGLSFAKGIFHEDSLFTPCTLYMANEVCPYDIPVYHRLVREGSITHYVNPKRCYDLCFVINELLSFSSRYVCSKDKKSWRNCVADCVNELLFLTKSCDDATLCDYVRNYVNRNHSIISSLICAKKRNTRIWGYLSKFSGGDVYKVYSVLFNLRCRYRFYKEK